MHVPGVRYAAMEIDNSSYCTFPVPETEEHNLTNTHHQMRQHELFMSVLQEELLHAHLPVHW
jgi:hypothetical protein